MLFCNTRTTGVVNLVVFISIFFVSMFVSFVFLT